MIKPSNLCLNHIYTTARSDLLKINAAIMQSNSMGAYVIFVSVHQTCFPNENRVHQAGDLCTAFVSHNIQRAWLWVTAQIKSSTLLSHKLSY